MTEASAINFIKRTNRRVWRPLAVYSALVCSFAALLLPIAARATENGACVYPVGVETVMPGMTPPPHATMLFEFTAFYTANQIDNSAGQSAAPEFKVRVLANAFRLMHNWNVPILGGKLNSNIAVPEIYQQLHIAPGDFSKSGLSNVDIGVFQVGYAAGSLHWFYEGDLFLPGAPHVKTDILNIGQNNYGTGPVAGFTWLPHHGEGEVSSKFLYLVNFHDTATHYRGGNEFMWEYDSMKEVTPRMAVGINGYLYQQTTNDLLNGLPVTALNGAPVSVGYRGRDLTVGPEVRIHFGKHSALAVKYLRDTLVENKPRGNAFWFQLGVPLSLGAAPGR